MIVWYGSLWDLLHDLHMCTYSTSMFMVILRFNHVHKRWGVMGTIAPQAADEKTYYIIPGILTGRHAVQKTSNK